MKPIVIGVMSQDQIRARALAIARGDYKPKPGEPRIWFTSMRSVAEVLSDQNRALLKELTDEFFERADEYSGDQLVRRGRPKAESTKVLLTVRYDADIVAAFRATGPGWQTRMNAALRDWLARHEAA